MNDWQRSEIRHLRKQGMGYKAIANKVKLSRDSVRNFCRWHQLAGYGNAIAAQHRKETTFDDIGYAVADIADIIAASGSV